jgi:integrase
MPKQEHHKTQYKGVTYIEGKNPGTGKPERIYYITYRKNGKLIQEKAGRAVQDDMTPAKANYIRAERMNNKELTNKERREEERRKQEAEAGKWTLDRLWEFYQQHKADIRALRIDKYRYDKYLKPHFGSKEPKDICPFDIERFKLPLLKTQKPATVKKALEQLRRIIQFGQSKHLCEGLKFTVEMPKFDNRKTEDLTPEQLQNLLKAIEESDNIIAKNMMLMALYTGMRRGELFRLKWNDIDFDKGFIHIREPKGGVDQTIPLNDSARKVLTEHPRLSDYVFPGRTGEKLTDIRKSVNRIKEKAGLPKDFRALHGLRHVYASMLASSGQVDMYTLQKLLTHKSPAMTQRYAHLRDETLKKASNLVGDIISQAVNNEQKVVNLKLRKRS